MGKIIGLIPKADIPKADIPKADIKAKEQEKKPAPTPKTVKKPTTAK